MEVERKAKYPEAIMQEEHDRIIAEITKKQVDIMSKAVAKLESEIGELRNENTSIVATCVAMKSTLMGALREAVEALENPNHTCHTHKHLLCGGCKCAEVLTKLKPLVKDDEE